MPSSSDPCLPVVTYREDLTRPGELMTSACPGLYAGVEADVASLGRLEIDTVYCLLEDEDFRDWRMEGLFDAYATAGLEVVRHPIRDFGVPSLQEMSEIVTGVLTALDAGRRVLVHCAAGLGRTGIVVACALVDDGLSPEAAITLVRARRRGSIVTAGQTDFVLQYAESRRGAP